jgi:amino acid transporter
MKRKTTKTQRMMKDTFAVGAGSMIGAGALGSMASMSGVPAGLGSNIMGAAGVGFTALNYGQALKNVQTAFGGIKTRRRKK